jgi:hypothetical protein
MDRIQILIGLDDFPVHHPPQNETDKKVPGKTGQCEKNSDNFRMQNDATKYEIQEEETPGIKSFLLT